MRLAYLLIATLLLNACSLTKKLPEEKKLYGESEVVLRTVHASVSKKQKTNFKNNATSKMVSRTNSFLLGYPWKVSLYYSVKEPKREKGIRNFIKYKLGEEPIFFDETTLSLNRQILANIAENKGYFRSTVQSDTIKTKYAVNVKYGINLMEPYVIREVNIDTSLQLQYPNIDVTKLVDTDLKPKENYDLDNIIALRKRLTSTLRNKGYYYVTEDQFIIEADTNLNSHQVNLGLKQKQDINPLKTRLFEVGTIRVKVSNNFPLDEENFEAYRGINVADETKRFKSKIFSESIVLEPAQPFSLRDQEISLARLSNLKNFQFVRSKLQLDTSFTTPKLDATFLLQPLKQKSIKGRLSGLTKSNGLYGSEGSLTWQNKNLFGGAERLSLEVNGGLDLQFGQNQNANRLTRLSTKADLTFPRFILPFVKPIISKNNNVPSTHFSVSYDRLRSTGLFTQSSINGEIRYDWRKNSEFYHSLTPAYVNYIRPSNISESFVDEVFSSDNILDIDRYFQLLESRLILGLKYNLDYTPSRLQSPTSKTYFRFGLDVAGNLASLLTNTTIEGSDFETLFGVLYEQFAIADVEVKQFNTFGNFKWANRAFVGFGLPYKNSVDIPQVKQYFVGGGYGLRGFRARSIGPGTTNPLDPSNSLFGFNATGDIKLEFTTELRQKINKYIEAATFFDAGNIWMYSEDNIYGPQAQLTKDFHKQFAIDYGLGIRLDFEYLILRADVAIPIRKPWQVESPWVFDEIQVGDKNWRQNNLVLNLAIGYPF